MTEQMWEGTANHPSNNEPTEPSMKSDPYTTTMYNAPITVTTTGPQVTSGKQIGRPITEEFVSSIGNASGQNLAAFTSKVLDQQKNVDGGEMGSKLNELIDASKDLSADKFKTGKVQQLMNKAFRMKDRAVARFETADERVKVLVKQMGKERDIQIRNARNVDTLIEGNYAYCKSLIQDIVVAKDALEQVNGELAALPEATESLDEAKKRSDLQNLSDKLEKKVVDLESFKILSMEFDPKLAQMKRTASSLVSTFDDVTTKIVPMYMQHFAQYLIAKSQDGAIELQNKTYDLFNETIKAGSATNAKNVENMARLNQRQIVNLDTMKQLHEDMVGSLQKVRAIEQEARETRKTTLNELARLEHDAIEAYSKK
jgi:uncharacterized protein YaaN involved in tellurite resistance